jgi:putative ABC transport system ATP-binding protein
VKQTLIRLKGINKNFKNLHVLKNVDLTIKESTFYAIMGPSGAGKTSLINIIGLLDHQSSGEYYLFEKNVSHYDQFKKAQIRNSEIGFIFQSFYLLPHLNAIENVMLPMYLDKSLSFEQMEDKAKALLIDLGLFERLNHYPLELSAGEQQRVAIARAMANSPKIIIADEPTGNLDEENEKYVFGMLRKMTLDGKTVIVVSHNKDILNYSDINLTIKEGILRCNDDEA